MLNKLKMILNKITENYTVKYLAAGLRQEWVGGVRVPAKKDVRRAFLMDVKMILETAKFHNIAANQLIEDKSLITEIENINDKDDNILDEVDLD